VKVLSKEAKDLLFEILNTSTEQLYNELKADNKFQDWMWEGELKQDIKLWKSWTIKAIGKPYRKTLLDIIKTLEQELEDVRRKNSANRRGTLGLRIRGNKQADRKAGNRTTNAFPPFPEVVGDTPQRIYRLGRKAK